MVRSCQAEPSVADHFDPLIRQRVAAQVGLLIGKAGVGSRDLLLAVIRTPLRDGQEPIECSGSSAAPASKGSSKAKAATTSGSSVQIDCDWVSEHATQVTRMLPGGLTILGTYVFCPESALQSAVEQLGSCDLQEASSASAAESEGPLLLHVDSTTKKLALKTLESGAAASSSGAKSQGRRSARPADLKLAPCLSSLVQISCSHEVQVSFGVAQGTAQLKEQLAAAVDAESRRLSGAMLLVPGKSGGAAVLPTPSGLVMDALSLPAAEPKGQAPGQPLPQCSVQLLLPLGCAPAPAGPAGVSGVQGLGVSSSGVQGQVVLRGGVHGVAYVHRREAISKAAECLKADLQASLRSRIDILVEDAFAWEEEQQEQQASQAPQQPAAAGAAPQHKSHPLLRRGALLAGAAFSLPRRVLIPWQSTGMVLCDYLLPGESVEAATDRAAELVGLELPGSEPGVLEVEAAQPAGPPLVPATWNPVAGSGAAKGAAGAAAAGAQGKGKATAGAAQGLAAGSDSGMARAGAGASCSTAAIAAAGASAAVALLAIGVGLMGMGR